MGLLTIPMISLVSTITNGGTNLKNKEKCQAGKQVDVIKKKNIEKKKKRGRENMLVVCHVQEVCQGEK